VRRHDRSASPHDDWTGEAGSALALAGFLALVFAGFTLLAMEPLVGIDAYLNLDPPPAGWLPVLHVLDRIGQRAICLPVLAVVVWLCCRREGSLRPAVLAAGGVFVLNLVVLVLKLGLGRGQPALADPGFFIGGMAYPSGHTANIVLVYGAAVYLMRRYLGISRRTQGILWSAVGGLSLLMVVVSVTLNWHWFADLVAGLLVGGVVLELMVAADAAMPRAAFDEGLRPVLRRTLTAARRRAPMLWGGGRQNAG
jgi:membrane-associated phospholipid phosphatase